MNNIKEKSILFYFINTSKLEIDSEFYRSTSTLYQDVMDCLLRPIKMVAYNESISKVNNHCISGIELP